MVTASTVLPTMVKKLPNTISVITAKEIEKINSPNVADVLRLTVPGAVYSQEGPGTQAASFSVRGVSNLGDGYTTMKVYVDGLLMPNAMYISYLDPNAIERIEVLPGPQASTIYGAHAINGIVQIFTKNGDVGKLSLSGKIGMTTVDNKYVGNNQAVGEEAEFQVNGGNSIITYNVGAHVKSEPQWLNLFEEKAFHLTGGTNIKLDKFTANISVNYSKRNSSDYDNPEYTKAREETGSTSIANSTIYDDLQSYGLTLSYQATQNWTNNLTLGLSSINYRNVTRTPDEGLFRAFESRNDEYTISYNTSLLLKLSEIFNGSITLGADWERWSWGSFFDFVPDRNNYEYNNQYPGEEDNYGFFGQTQISIFDFLHLTGGLRADKNQGEAENAFTWSPRLGLALTHEVEDWMVKGRWSWGQSVVLAAQDFINGYQTSYEKVISNHSLKAEVQRGWELGADLYYLDILSLGFTYFNQKPMELTDKVPLGMEDDLFVYQYQNLGEIKNEGIEIKAVANPVEWLVLNLNYGTTNSKITKLCENYSGGRQVGEELAGRPKYSISANVEIIPFKGTSISFSAFKFGGWVGIDEYAYYVDQVLWNWDKEYPRDYYIDYPSYTKFNIGINQKISNSVSAYLQISNLTNTDRYERTNMVTTQPRTMILGIRFSGLTL